MGNPPRDHSSFCEFLYGAPRRQLAVCPKLRPLCALRVRSRVSKYIYIDAVRCVFVTRETLLRYTPKSALVNNLIGGKLWKRFTTDRLSTSRSLRSFEIHTPAAPLPLFWHHASSPAFRSSMCMMFPAQKRLAQNGVSFLTRSSRPRYRRMLLPTRYSEARLGSRRALLGHSRPGCRRLPLRHPLW